MLRYSSTVKAGSGTSVVLMISSSPSSSWASFFAEAPGLPFVLNPPVAPPLPPSSMAKVTDILSVDGAGDTGSPELRLRLEMAPSTRRMPVEPLRSIGGCEGAAVPVSADGGRGDS